LKVMELLRSAAGKGTGIMVVLHDLSLAARFCDRLVLIAQGGIIAQGPPSVVLTPEHLQRAYGLDVVCGESEGLPYFLPRSAAPSFGDHP
jgi:iron complex transport system ATP-binding protein